MKKSYHKTETRQKWLEENKEKLNEYKRNEYHKKKNDDEFKKRKNEHANKYYEKHRDKLIVKGREDMRKRRETPEHKKKQRIYNWKKRGIICDNFDTLYEQYVNCNDCDFCGKVFSSDYDRCLDHAHENGEIHQKGDVRGILCRGCNVKDVLNSM
jgi:hypothetical protein